MPCKALYVCEKQIDEVIYLLTYLFLWIKQYVAEAQKTAEETHYQCVSYDADWDLDAD